MPVLGPAEEALLVAGHGTADVLVNEGWRGPDEVRPGAGQNTYQHI